MLPKTGAFLFRLLFVVLIGGFVAFASVPGVADGHAGSSDSLSETLVDESGADHHADTASSSSGHCHPGLDCFTAGAFLLLPALSAPLETGKSKVWFSHLESESWASLPDNPPPRNQS